MIKIFLESPANRAGISAWLATAITALVQYLVTHAAPPVADLFGLVIGFVALVQPDNSVTTSQLEKAISDVRIAIATKSPASLGAVIVDVQGLVSNTTGSKPLA
jgi:hypothetical protein